MISVLVHCTIDDKDELIAQLYELGTTGIVENEQPGGDCILDVFFDTPEEAHQLIAAMPERNPRLVDHGQRNYVEEFQAHWQPMPIGNRLYLSPPWDPTPPPPPRLRIDYQPGMACGSGAHPCTRLCLEALESAVTPGARVLDIGAGSGILLIAARALGASLLAGCDIEHDAVTLAAQAVPAAFFTGSARSIRDASFDVVIANISSIAAEQLHADMRRIAAPNGTLIASGFRTSEWPADFPGQRHELEGWGLIIAHPPR